MSSSSQNPKHLHSLSIFIGAIVVAFFALRILLMGGGTLFHLLHLEGDSYDRYQLGGCYNGCAPTLSADGRYVVYSSPRTGRGDLYRVNIDGTQTTRLTQASQYEAEPSFSPDSKQIVYAKQVKVGNSYISQLWQMNTDGSHQRQITRDQANYINPTFTPDGMQLLCERVEIGSKQVSIILMNLDGGHIIHLIGEAYPVMTSDGKQIYYSDSENIGVMNRDGSHRKELGNGYCPAVSPDGKQVVFCNEPYSQTLWLMNCDGSNRHQIYTHANHYLEHARFTPDGQHILFHEALDQGVGDIMLIDVEGMHPKRIASTR